MAGGCREWEAPEGVDGGMMRRVSPPASSSSTQRPQRCLDPAAGGPCGGRLAGSCAEAEGAFVDAGAPFAVMAAGGGGRDARGLDTLLRLLAPREPGLLASGPDEAPPRVAGPDVVGGVGLDAASIEASIDASLDSLLSMPSPSDLSVVSA